LIFYQSLNYAEFAYTSKFGLILESRDPSASIILFPETVLCRKITFYEFLKTIDLKCHLTFIVLKAEIRIHTTFINERLMICLSL